MKRHLKETGKGQVEKQNHKNFTMELKAGKHIEEGCSVKGAEWSISVDLKVSIGFVWQQRGHLCQQKQCQKWFVAHTAFFFFKRFPFDSERSEESLKNTSNHHFLEETRAVSFRLDLPVLWDVSNYGNGVYLG